ncbi:MAG: hypothetical protein B7Z55_03710 [Planctomycetales bacterium 12-60-4]|nr:MAG: hypothetical protein B7Z55_03710 [Planctomycetales bacterium 12-60-4]
MVLVSTTLKVQNVVPKAYPSVGESVVEANYKATNGTFLYLQDTRDWYAWHRGNANILMFDGAVRVVNDINGDGYFNPGFTATGGTSESAGYTDAVCEMNSFEIFNGIFLSLDIINKDKFE